MVEVHAAVLHLCAGGGRGGEVRLFLQHLGDAVRRGAGHCHHHEIMESIIRLIRMFIT